MKFEVDFGVGSQPLKHAKQNCTGSDHKKIMRQNQRMLLCDELRNATFSNTLSCSPNTMETAFHLKVLHGNGHWAIAPFKMGQTQNKIMLKQIVAIQMHLKPMFLVGVEL